MDTPGNLFKVKGQMSTASSEVDLAAIVASLDPDGDPSCCNHHDIHPASPCFISFA
jgi:hypothetical protein